MIPVYSNVYFDFYTRRLQDYQISENVTWGQAVVYSRLTDAPDPEEETGEEGEAAENGGEAPETDEEDVIEIDEENTIEIDD